MIRFGAVRLSRFGAVCHGEPLWRTLPVRTALAQSAIAYEWVSDMRTYEKQRVGQ